MLRIALALGLLAGCVDGPVEDVGETAAALTPVSWTDLVGVSAAGNDLTKTAPDAAWTAGAVSAASLAGDGYIEFTTGETTTTKMVGLSHGNRNEGYRDIDFAFRLKDTGKILIFERGVLIGGYGFHAAGDTFRIQVEGGVVTYFREGELLHTSAAVPVFPLLVDTSLYTPGATLEDVGMQSLDPYWENMVGVAASGRDLSKTDPSSKWNAGATSAGSITNGYGYAEWTVGDATTVKAAGLSSGNGGESYADIDFAIYMNGAGGFSVYESGVRIGSFGVYRAGDRFRVQVLGNGQVAYSMNGAWFYTSAVAPTFPLLLDTALHTPGASLLDARIGIGYGPQCAVAQQVLEVPGVDMDAAGDVFLVATSTGSKIYRSSPTGWGLEQTIPTVASQVATDGQTLATSSSTAARAYRHGVTQWVLDGTLSPCPGDSSFGDVAVQGDVMVVGSSSTGAGRAYVLRRSGGTWGLDAVLLDPDGVAGDSFGRQVAVAGDRLFVAATGVGAGGAVYVFRHDSALPDPSQPASCSVLDPGKWSQEAVLIPPTGHSVGYDQIDVNRSGSRLITGDSGPQNTGTDAHVWDFSLGVWDQTALISYPNIRIGDYVALGGPGADADSIALVGYRTAVRARLFGLFDAGWRQMQRFEDWDMVAATADTLFLRNGYLIHVFPFDAACLTP
jgi:hypothetical protein